MKPLPATASGNKAPSPRLPLSKTWSGGETRFVPQILPALRDPSLIARLILRAYQAVRPPTLLRFRIDVALGGPNGAFDMASIRLRGTENPGLLRLIGEKTAKLAASRASAAHGTRPPPICRRRQG